ncbi:hypothetical protein LJC05_02615 [Bacteroides sp. OttesenSCG-928-J23]|nr:hypothetical protein [Bacteroides sp. OttesenSCG-928-J23]MDL2304981.1 hypothetical protein [Bacteroides sp. OttesenSCG-928-D19]
MNERITLKECFVVLPMGNAHAGYEELHFERVYKKLIKPSILAANYKPIRMDEVQSGTNGRLEVLSHLISMPVAIFDLSAKDGHVLTALGIRNSYHKVSLLLQDERTSKNFDTSKLEYIEYNHLLPEAYMKMIQDKIINRLLLFG